MTDRPLITFALSAYNQEQFIREAVEGAFAQTYSPLEIILSDDFSNDKTFEIMQEMASNYTGPNKITLNRNEKNKGITGHINKIMKLAGGDLIVDAAGDDISLPQRTQVLVDKWLSTGRKAHSIHSDAIAMDVHSQDIGIIRNHNQKQLEDLFAMASRNPHVLGATHAWAKEVFTVFGPLNEDVTHEDCVIPLRSALLGGVVHVPEPLVRYRQDVGVSANYLTMETENIKDPQAVEIARRYYFDALQKVRDLKTFGADVRLISGAERALVERALICDLVSAPLPKLRHAWRAIRDGARLWFAFKQFIKYKFSIVFYAKMVVRAKSPSRKT